MVTTIIVSVVTLIIGFAVAWGIKSKGEEAKQIESSSEGSKPIGFTTDASSDTGEADKLKRQLEEANKKIEELDSSLQKAKAVATDSSSIEEAKKLKKQLDEANKRIKDLDSSLQTAMNGKVDEASQKQIKELKKKISDLEEEKEDLEDDLNAKFKKKTRSLEEEKSKLEDDLKKSKKDLEAKDGEIEKINDELKEVKDKSEVKSQSLSFVSEVLTAKKPSDGSLEKAYDAIDDIYDIVIEDLQPIVKDWFTEDADRDAYFFGEGLEKWKVLAKKKWIKNRATIAFIGEFSAGKTSVVNRILSQDKDNVAKLPVSTKATTAIPTYIMGGNITKFQFVSPDNELKVISENTFKKVSKEVLDEVSGASSLIKYFVMEYQNSNLNNISILDTPGFSSNDNEDTVRTMDVINECDALFWVFDVNNGTVNRNSINIIKKYKRQNQPLYVVINKVDTKPDSEVAKVENLIKTTLERDNGIQVTQYIRFSGGTGKQGDKPKVPLSNIMNCINQVSHDTSADDFVSHLDSLMDDLVRCYREALSESTKKYNEQEKIVDQTANNFVDVAKRVQSKCEDTSRFGSYEEKWFRDDVYEFSKYEYNQLHNNLEYIYGGMKDLWDRFSEYGESCSNSQFQYGQKCDHQMVLSKLESIKDKLNKRIKELE